MRVLLYLFFTLLLCLNSFSQGLPDCDESQLSISPNDCIIVGDEIEFTSTYNNVGIFEPPLTFSSTPINFGPPPYDYEFLSSGNYIIVGFTNGWLGPQAQCIKEITVVSDELYTIESNPKVCNSKIDCFVPV